MAVDIGAEAINRSDTYVPNRTCVLVSNPATVNGKVTSIDIWANSNITGLRVGTFYKTNGNTLKCRASQAIEGTIVAGSKVTKAVSILVEIGDYIGEYYTGGAIERDTAGFPGVWRTDGEHIDSGDEASYTLMSSNAFSLGGYIEEVVGWTGEIAGVTNPASIMGVDVANIKSVKGVE